MTDSQLGELIEAIARNEGVGLEVSVQTSAADTLMVTLYSIDTTNIREEFTTPRPEPEGAREEFIGTVREHARAIKRKLGQT